MDDKDKLLLYGIGSVAILILISRGAGGGMQSVIAPTALERAVMKNRALIWTSGVNQNVDPGLIAAVMANESSGRNIAPRQVEVTLYTGEKGLDWVTGLMQVRLDTAKENCDLWHQYELRDAAANVQCGTKYLRLMLNRFKSIAAAVSAYNAGPGSIPYDWSMVGGLQFTNLRYVRNVLRMIDRFRLLFMSWKSAQLYQSLFNPSEWAFDMP